MSNFTKIVIEHIDETLTRESMIKYIHHSIQTERNVVIEWMRPTENESQLGEKVDYIKIAADGSVFWSMSDESDMKKIGHLNEEGQVILHEGICLL